MIDRAARAIFMTEFSPQELARLEAAVALHYMAQIAEPDFEQVWFDNISASQEVEWDAFANYHESARFGR